MCRDRAKCTTTETPTMDIYRKLNHIVCRNSLAFVFGMRQTGVGQIVRMIEFSFRQGWVRRIDNNSHTIYFLCNTGSSIFITLFFNVAEIGSLLLLVFQTFSMRKETDISFFTDEIRCLA